MDRSSPNTPATCCGNEQYMYEPLESSQFMIRIFTLYGIGYEYDDDEGNNETEVDLESDDDEDNFDVPVEGRLDIVPLSEAPKYEALSYVWGSEQRPCTIIVNEKALKVTENLSTALQYLRRDHARTLWIDAICIDQDNTQERSHQVRQMQNIFAAATQVLVWLGAGDQDTEAIMEGMSIHRHEYRVPGLPLGMALARRPELRAGIAKLINNPWWYRIWTVQELLIYGQRHMVGYGYCWLAWGGFSSAFFNVILHRKSHELNWLHMDETAAEGLLQFDSTILRQASRGAGRKFDLLALLTCSNNRGATDVRDRIFALAGLVDVRIERIIRPDYSLETPVVYQKATIALLHEDAALEPLASTARKRRGLPTWCIDFANRDSFNCKHWPDYFLDFENDSGMKSVLAASGLLSLNILHHRSNRGELYIEGCMVDRVETVATGIDWNDIEFPAEGNAESFDGCACDATWNKFVDRLQAVVTPYLHKRDTEDLSKTAAYRVAMDAVLETVSGGKRIFKTAQRYGANGRPEYKLQSRGEDVWVDPSSSAEKLTFFLLHLPQMIQWPVPSTAALFRTKNGYIGRAHSTIRAGDRVCILFGCKQPIVLRRVGTKYEFVTTAYVHGIMRGEFVADMKAVSSKVFCLV